MKRRPTIPVALFALIFIAFLALASAEVAMYPEEDYKIDIRVSPDMGEYLPGQKINSVTVTIRSKEGNLAGDAAVSGSLEPNKAALAFTGNGGSYTSEIGYKVLSSDNRLLTLEIEAVVSGETISAKKFLLTKPENMLNLRINSPAKGAEVALGQKISFEAEVTGIASPDVVLIDERTGEKLDLQAAGSGYSASFVVPKNIENEASFIVFASSGNAEGAERISIKKAAELFLEKNLGKQDAKTGKLAYLVRYIGQNGQLISSSSLKAEITSSPGGRTESLTLTGSDDAFVGVYNKREGETSAIIKVTDEYGNVGETDVPPEFFSMGGKVSSEGMQILYVIIIIIAVGGIGAALALRPRKAAGPSKKDEIEGLKAEKERLEGLIKQTKLDFYKHRIESDAANKKITETEEKLSIVNKKLEELEK